MGIRNGDRELLSLRNNFMFTESSDGIIKPTEEVLADNTKILDEEAKLESLDHAKEMQAEGKCDDSEEKIEALECAE